MTVFLHEMKRSRTALLIWSAAIASMLAIAVLIYPQMAPQMEEMDRMMSDMGSFSAAFGMDRMNFGQFTDYFTVECGNVLGLGAAIFAAITGAAMLNKEERGHTAEFLFTHPVSRSRVMLEKLAALVAQLVVLNLIIAAVSLGAVSVIGENPDYTVIGLLFLAYFLLELEIALLCFCISAFLRNGLGAGLGLALGMYFLNILSNITEDAKFLKYFTPFAYTEGADILQNQTLTGKYLAVGACLSIAAVTAAFLRFQKKDLTA